MEIATVLPMTLIQRGVPAKKQGQAALLWPFAENTDCMHAISSSSVNYALLFSDYCRAKLLVLFFLTG